MSTAPPPFVFAGVGVEVLLDANVVWQLPEAFVRHLLAPSAAAAADVVCSVRLDPGLRGRTQTPEQLAYWRRSPDGLCVTAEEVVLEICQTAERHFAVAARVGSNNALPAMLLLLAATVVELIGGLCLHATAVELGGEAVLLLGPSGTGKTTAAQQLGAVRCLANDRVNVINTSTDPAQARFEVWSLPIGRPPTLEPSAGVMLPLGALVRIVQASEPRLRPLHMSEAMLYVREAIEVGVDSGFFEPQRLAAVGCLAVAAKSGIADVVLGRSWRGELDGFLRPSAPEALS
ncbi:MAG: hypothetical protein ABW321_21760 [Polyangiales bacterium]